MGKTKSVKYHSLSLPVDFINEIKEYIKDKSGYRSVADFARTSMINQLKAENYENEFKKQNRPINLKEFQENPIYKDKMRKAMDAKLFYPKKSFDHLGIEEKLDLIIQMIYELPPQLYFLNKHAGKTISPELQKKIDKQKEKIKNEKN